MMTYNEVFVMDMATFIIYDDLKVVPYTFETTIFLPINLAYEDFNAIKVVSVNITKMEIIDILKYSLLSETPLTDLFVRKKEFSMNSNLMSGLNFDISEPETNAGGEMMKVKMLRKLSKQLNDEDWSWNNLNTLCWAIGSISGSLIEEQYFEDCQHTYYSDELLNEVKDEWATYVLDALP